MNKLLTFLVSAVAVLLILGIFAFASAANETQELNSTNSDLISEESNQTLSESNQTTGESNRTIGEQVSAIINSSNPSLPTSVSNYVEDFVARKGVSPEKISNVSRVSFDDLPKEVNIENVNDNNLAIYQVDYNDTSAEQKKMFVITYSVDKLRAQGDLIVSHDKRMFLNFGLAKEISNSEFLNTASGVEGSLEKGYVMMRGGSITGISTALEITKLSESGQIEIVIYKNGEPIGFGNTISTSVAGIKKDYDVQSKGVVSFEPGDVISAYVNVDGSARDVITLVEITTTE